PRRSDGIYISAGTGEGIPALQARIEEFLAGRKRRVEFFVPYANYDAVQAIRNHGNILEEMHEEDGTRIRCLMESVELAKLKGQRIVPVEEK
ncbi:MAG: hypothetical protein FWF10_12040, partial [Clostridiales bacterium]|nr:hypothetical protein [Clostridiales bacterium]